MSRNYELIESLCFDFESKYLHFELSNEQNPSTWIIDVFNNEDDEFVLGQVRWYAQWRQYGFYPSDGTVYEKTCMNDITRFLILLNEQQKKGIKPENPQILITDVELRRNNKS